MNTIVAKLKKRKKELGLSNQELSTLSGVPYGTVCRVLSKMDGTPNLQTLKDLSKALNISIDDLIGLHEEQETEPCNAEGTSPEVRNSSPDEEKSDTMLSTAIHAYEMLLQERQHELEIKDRWLTRLFVICCALVGVIITVLAIDLLNPTVGFFQR